MIELAGNCVRCGKPVFCTDGFINGVTQADGNVLCFGCDGEESAQEKSG
ncbi:hypothetical protein [Marininema mesophilum]|nr:hypothetical protein [Marininema mesophilum]